MDHQKPPTGSSTHHGQQQQQPPQQQQQQARSKPAYDTRNGGHYGSSLRLFVLPLTPSSQNPGAEDCQSEPPTKKLTRY
jgi:hypothetical protein